MGRNNTGVEQPAREGKFRRSQAFLKQAEAVIPLGSQTFSKSRVQFPYGVSPYFAERGEGAYLWDIDGNRYIDFLSGLLSISLGYCDPDVDAAVQQQMKKGVTFSLPHRLETQLAELLVELIPCAERVRFGKNGTDATSAAVRLARAYTGRDRIAVCGYHGWQDWYISTTTRDLGVPGAVKGLSHKFNYNDLESLVQLFAEYPGEFAAVIMEPMGVQFPRDDFLARVKALSHREGALLIFDETITGFRFDIGGAQTYFNVIPDLATFGKGMANGYPLSAVVGRAEIMALMEDIFYSGTFGGETLSLAASIAVIEKMRRESVLEHLTAQGKKIQAYFAEEVNSPGATGIAGISGHPAWTCLTLHGSESATGMELKTLFMQEMLARGILMQFTHNLSYSHKGEEIDALLRIYREVLPLLQEAAKEGKVQALLRGRVLEPLFKVR